MAARAQASSGRRNTHRNTRPVYGNDYVQGSAAPKLRPQSAPKQETRQGKSSGSQSVRSNHRIRRNQERAMYMDLPYVIMLTIASVFTLYLCINYLHVQSSITARMHHIEQMEAELEQLRAETTHWRPASIPASTSTRYMRLPPRSWEWCMPRRTRCCYMTRQKASM